MGEREREREAEEEGEAIKWDLRKSGAAFCIVLDWFLRLPISRNNYNKTIIKYHKL